MNIKPIETAYNGYRFRSRLEARWAVFFDAVGIEYYYEPEGIKLSDGTYYLPDFYLPKSKQWFEVKGVMKEDDEHKIKQLIEDANVSVAVGHPDMTFQACDKWWDGTYQLADKYSSILVRCRDCGGLWFMGTNGNFECPCCGEHDGDHHLGESIDGNGNDKWYGSSSVLESARLKAKQVRFEYGDTPKSQSVNRKDDSEDWLDKLNRMRELEKEKEAHERYEKHGLDFSCLFETEVTPNKHNPT